MIPNSVKGFSNATFPISAIRSLPFGGGMTRRRAVRRVLSSRRASGWSDRERIKHKKVSFFSEENLKTKKRMISY